MPNPNLGMGSTMQIWAGSSGSWTKTTVANITKISPPKGKTDSIDTTVLASTSGYKTSMPGLIDPGEMSIEGFLYYGKASDTSNQSSLYTAFVGRTTGHYGINFASGAVLDFDGYVTAFELDDVSSNEPQTFKASIKVSGQPTFTPATT